MASVEGEIAKRLRGMEARDQTAGDRVQVVGDDYLVTNAERAETAAMDGACNAVLVKPNQVGTLSEAHTALTVARENGFGAIGSTRSGEIEVTTIAHLTVGWGALQLEVGSITRGERTAQRNEELRIADALGDGGRLPDPKLFPWGAPA